MSVTVVQESSTLPGMYIEMLHAIIKPFTLILHMAQDWGGDMCTIHVYTQGIVQHGTASVGLAQAHP